MDRIPEPELMLDEDQARAYAAADFAEPHARLIELLQERLSDLPDQGWALDLGCGAADIAIRFVRAFPGWRVDGIDGSPAMLRFGHEAVAAARLGDRVALREGYLPGGAVPGDAYDLVFSNSLLHHLADPAVLWASLRRWAGDNARVFVQDLLRPEGRAQAERLVDLYAAGEPEVLRRDFFNSLLAAYRIVEVEQQLVQADLGHLSVEQVSDRHWIVWGRL
ncbi:MAG: class I SAM-dependent methyltransferase [Nitrospirota bacterium]